MPTIWQARWWSILLTPIVNEMIKSNELIQMLITECFIFFGTFINLKIKKIPYTYVVKKIRFFLILILILTRQLLFHSLSYATCLILILERNNNFEKYHTVILWHIKLVFNWFIWFISFWQVLWKENLNSDGTFGWKYIHSKKLQKPKMEDSLLFISHKFLCQTTCMSTSGDSCVKLHVCSLVEIPVLNYMYVH